ncbi:MAG: fasciclin domain-containing protein [Candidatus Bathyarchaeia archaeon]|jgi:uncharacterized surface protein with fasciclin (FAS1) repeats
MPNIVDAAISAGNFNTLVKAVQAAGLVDALKAPGPFTVFAPTDEAFSKWSADALDALLLDTARLKNVLLYHVTEGKMMAADLDKHEYLRALNGGELKIDNKRWHLHRHMKVNDASIITPDIVVDNGVCHAIDRVLMPKINVETKPM